MSNTIPPNLRWACRRGMLELDIWLGNFLDTVYLNSPQNEQLLFENLLKCEDQDLFEWFTGKKIPADAETIYIINKIRSAKQQS